MENENTTTTETEALPILFLDDSDHRWQMFCKSHPGQDAIRATTAFKCIELLKDGRWSEVWLDHDLSHNYQDRLEPNTGMEVVRALESRLILPEPHPLFVVHSLNGPAALEMVKRLRALGFETVYRPFGLTEELLKYSDLWPARNPQTCGGCGAQMSYRPEPGKDCWDCPQCGRAYYEIIELHGTTPPQGLDSKSPDAIIKLCSNHVDMMGQLIERLVALEERVEHLNDPVPGPLAKEEVEAPEPVELWCNTCLSRKHCLGCQKTGGYIPDPAIVPVPGSAPPPRPEPQRYVFDGICRYGILASVPWPDSDEVWVWIEPNKQYERWSIKLGGLPQLSMVDRAKVPDGWRRIDPEPTPEGFTLANTPYLKPSEIREKGCGECLNWQSNLCRDCQPTFKHWAPGRMRG